MLNSVLKRNPKKLIIDSESIPSDDSKKSKASIHRGHGESAITDLFLSAPLKKKNDFRYSSDSDDSGDRSKIFHSYPVR